MVKSLWLVVLINGCCVTGGIHGIQTPDEETSEPSKLQQIRQQDPQEKHTDARSRRKPPVISGLFFPAQGMASPWRGNNL